MSKKLPDDEMDQQFSDFHLPDEEASWQKMKELLDKDDDDGRIVPPVFLRSCMGWGILILAGLIASWLLTRPAKWWTESAGTKPNSSSDKHQKHSDYKTRNQDHTFSMPPPNTVEPGMDKLQRQPNRSVESRLISSGKNHISSAPISAKKKKPLSQTKPPISKKSDLVAPPIIVRDKPINTQPTGITIQKDKLQNQQKDFTVKDSLKQNKIQSEDTTTKKNANSPQKKWIVAAGLGLQQQIPVAGQTVVPYSYYGRESSWADYIPSVFLKLQMERKWFIMGEFRYGAAQQVKAFSYNQHTRYDTASMNVTMTTMHLKKTYYHQLPFSFNYFVNRDLSVGIGGMYSRFYGAITEKETDTWNALTQTTTNFKEIIPIKHFNDSFLYKTQVHILMQADYQWKRFSFGLRYSRDLQPYIKYTKPDGTIDEEKNQSLQFILRFKVWQSAKL